MLINDDILWLKVFGKISNQNLKKFLEDKTDDEEASIITESLKLKDSKKLSDYISSLSNQNIQVLCYLDENYPTELKELSDSPMILYCKGDVGLLAIKTKLSIIGSRRMTDVSTSNINKIAESKFANDRIIVSGLAIGVDSYVHQKFMKKGNKLIAVLGSPINVCYPPSKISLYRHIENNGLIISEYEPGSRINTFNFVIRNRIIAALCDDLLVIQSSLDSGSIQTIMHAKKLDKNIHVVIGDLSDDSNLGNVFAANNYGAKIFSLGFDVDNAEYMSNLHPLVKQLKRGVGYTIGDLSSLNLDNQDINLLLLELEIQNQIVRRSDGRYYQS